MCSSTMRIIAVMGTLKIAPALPHTKYQNASDRSTITGWSSSDAPNMAGSIMLPMTAWIKSGPDGQYFGNRQKRWI